MKATLLPLLIVVSASSFSGCSAVNSLNPFSDDKIVFATAEDPAVEVVCLWEPSEGRDERGIPTRGFNGQLLFFNRTSQEPVVVDGDVKIFQFDEYGPKENWSKPVAEFNFSSAEWNSFLAKGLLGPGYHVFIPYDRKHSEQVNVALQVRFTPRHSERPLYSRMNKMTLPGTLRSEQYVDRMNRYTEVRDAGEKGFQSIVNRELETLGTEDRQPDPRVETIHRFEQSHSGSLPAPAEKLVPSQEFESPGETDTQLFSDQSAESARRRFEVSASYSATN